MSGHSSDNPGQHGGLSRRQFAMAGAWTAAGLAGAAVAGTAPAYGAAVLNRVYTITARERPRTTDAPKYEFRAFWLSSVLNIDWPSRAGLSAAAQQAELRGWLDLARSLNFNAVMLQVRPAGDVFWPSRRGEPWSRYLTGVQGRNPGYDPLAYAVAQAHARNLQLHAWFNPFRAGMAAALGDLIASHPARKNPSWSFAYGGRRYYNPGLPAVRSFIIGVINEVAAGYDIDGVHLDDYFYPYPVAGQAIPDSAAYQAYRTPGESLADFRRRSVNLFVRDLAARIRATKPGMLFGISPFGIWRNRSTDSRGSATSGFQAYDGIYADARHWVKQNWIDYVVPQLYWHQGFAAADYNVLVDWWAAQVAGTTVKLYIGEAAYKVGDAAQGAAWADPRQLYNHTAKCRATPAVKGQIYFSAKSVRANRLGALTLVKNKYYRRVAMTPAMPQRGAGRPYTPVITGARWKGTGVELSWRGAVSGILPRHFAIYRWESSGATAAYIPSQAGALRQVQRRRGNPERFVDTGAVRGRTYWYVVVALSGTMVESGGASAIFIRA
ncbi:glycoside hydrolase family 10 protein [Arthrobacter mobilis]|uniref:Family 10 glycosylhydrolase n=1 Tax=Arthrobacter mobilis TaxID=2724944 RepID=A0A7X6HCR3_9MICC|nr:family 10 glycosylhydrolase [Arthrobacter mobilis]NKX53541.1 family 10 glycosylhydrolase [Arthrobacter mobilis]